MTGQSLIVCRGVKDGVNVYLLIWASTFQYEKSERWVLSKGGELARNAGYNLK